MSRTNRRPRRRGFTLMEVLLVLVILVILASMAMVAIGPMRKRAQINAAKSQIGMFASPLQAYQLDMGDFPPTQMGLPALRVSQGEANWGGPYIDRDIPLDPWGNLYRYQWPGNNDPERPDIWSAGPDMQDGTADDIGNWQN